MEKNSSFRTLVTGGRSAIGESIIRRRLEFGDQVLTTASSEPTFLDLQERFPNESNLQLCQWDLSQPTVHGEVIKNFINDGIHALVLNAAPPTVSLLRFHELPEDDLRAYFEASVFGNMWILKQCLQKMSEQNFGRILFISSIAVLGTSRYSAYAASKSAIEGLIRVISTDYGEFNIRANTLRPGIIATARNKRFWSRSDYADLMTELIPATELGKPQDVAEATDPFLARNCYLNGVDLIVSGGLPNFRSELLLKAKTTKPK